MHAVDSYEPFREIDLLWCEGAAYNIGFSYALKTWHPALSSRGFAVVSELSWLRDTVSAEVRQFFRTNYPDMRSADENRSIAHDAGYCRQRARPTACEDNHTAAEQQSQSHYLHCWPDIEKPVIERKKNS